MTKTQAYDIIALIIKTSNEYVITRIIMSKSLYQTLEIQESATPDEIKKAYRKLARKFHPDVNKDKDAEETFKEINAAYEVLSDKEKKVQYDQYGDSMFGGQNFHDFAQNQGSGDLDDILKQMFGNQGGFGGGFGGGFSGGFEPDLDMNTQITIAFDISILGGNHHISLNHDSFDIKIPKGIKDGQKKRAKGKGKSHGSQKGDLLILIHVAPSPLYERRDFTLLRDFDIPLKTALFGGKVLIKTLYKDITLKVPSDTKQNQKFRVKELGVPNRKTSVNGDLFLKANIVLPKIEDMDEDFVKQLEEFLPEV